MACKFPMTEAECNREAWRRMCKVFEAEYITEDEAWRCIQQEYEECRILFGDPNKAQPCGTITVHSKGIRYA